MPQLPRVAYNLLCLTSSIVVIAFLVFCFRTQTTYAAPTVKIYLASTTLTTFVVPSDWNSSNTSIETFGGGAGGTSASDGGGWGGGGGGGGYSKATNVSLTAGATVSYAIGTGGATSTAGSDSYFCNSTSNCASIAG